MSDDKETWIKDMSPEGRESLAGALRKGIEQAKFDEQELIPNEPMWVVTFMGRDANGKSKILGRSIFPSKVVALAYVQA